LQDPDTEFGPHPQISWLKFTISGLFLLFSPVFVHGVDDHAIGGPATMTVVDLNLRNADTD
jgi:hypothetical protein